jgi:hypothetical protein
MKLLAPAAALIVAPELLIPRKTFFLPPIGGWYGYMTATEVLARQKEYMQDAAAAYERMYGILVNPPVISRETWIDATKYKPGDLVSIKPGGIYRTTVGFNFVTSDKQGNIIPWGSV